jgi:xylulose-5-phosphate/fructose-6-phosphate phosphoketolase
MYSASLQNLDAWWRAANYLSAGQIYLLANLLLREPLRREHIKPRLLGHWGTTPGLNFIYAHLNRVIRERDLDMIYVIGPGHGGPALLTRQRLSGGHVHRNLSRSITGRRGAHAPIQAVLLSRRRPEPRRARDTWIHP